MDVNFSKEETAAIIKYLRLSMRERKSFVDELVSSEFAAMYSKGYRSSLIFERLTRKYHKSEAWLRGKIRIKSLNQ